MAQSTAPSPFSPSPEKSDSWSWLPIAIGVGAVALIIFLLVWFGRDERKPAPPNPYLTNLKVSDVKLAAAQNFVGGTVTYVDGKLTNLGDKTVTAATAQVIFRNALGEIVQREEIPVRILVWQGPDRNVVDLRSAPLKPGVSGDFRLTIEGNISTDWNQGYPEVRIVSASVQ